MATFFEEMGCDPADIADYTPAAEPVVSRMLELSTAHVPDADAYEKWIERVFMSGYEGDVVPVDVGAYATARPDWLREICAHANALGCAWIHFDADGPIDPALPFWKW